MRWGFLSTLALVVLGVVANPVQEESSMTVGIAETVSCDGSHFIVSVERTDDVKEDSGELIAERVSNIVFDFKVDREAESLLINGYALKLIPQQIQKMVILAVVIPPNHPSLPENAETGSIKLPEVIDALSKLERTGLVTADVDLFITYEGDTRQVVIQVRVTEVEGCMVVHKDLLTAQIILPQHQKNIDGHKNNGQDSPAPSQSVNCGPSDWICRLTNWVNSLTPCGLRPLRSEGPDGRRPDFRGDSHRHPGGNHRHRFNRPRHGFMKFIISVVVPVLIGAAAGVGIGILSVFIAEFVGGIIMKIRGRRNAGYTEIDRKDDDEADDAGEELPVYEELQETPAYPEEKQ